MSPNGPPEPVAAGWAAGLAQRVVAHRRRVLVAWAIAVVAALIYSAPLATLLRGDISRVPGSASARVTERLSADFAYPFAHALVVTFQATPAAPVGAVAARRADLARKLAAQPSVRAVRPVDGADGRTAALLVGFGAATPEDEERSVGLVRGLVSSAAAGAPEGVAVATTGLAAFNHDFVTLGSAQASESELRVLPLVLGALLLAFGALGAALAPLATGLAAVALAMAGLTAVAQATHLSVYALNIASMLGLGLGIDYALLVVARIREERAAGHAPTVAVVRAATFAGPALAAAALAVLVGVAALATVPLPELRGMALGGGLVAVLALVASLSLLPALAATLGDRLDWPAALSTRLVTAASQRRWARLAQGVVARPLLALGAAALVLGALASPLAHFKFGFPELSSSPQGLEAAVGLQRIREMGLGGRLMPIQLVFSLPEGEEHWLTPRRLVALAQTAAALRARPEVAEVITLAPQGPLLQRTVAAAALLGPTALGARLPEEAGWLLSRDGRDTLMVVIPRSDRAWASVRDLARELREQGVPPRLAGVEMLVGGPAAVEVDAIDLCAGAMPGLAGLIAGATALALGWLTRSLVVPLKAIVANLATVAAAIGATIALAASPTTSPWLGLSEPVATVPAFFPIMVFCLLFGLSIDYEVILISRIQEAHRRGLTDPEAVVAGVTASGGIVTSAAAIMVMVFLGFAFTELVPIKLLGIALAIGVALDATIVRLFLVPSLMVLLGRWNWWPGDKVNP